MDRIYQTTITVPSGTSAVAPTTTTIPLENAYLVDVEVLIPPGHAGLTGIRVRQSLQQVIPWSSNSWISSDNYNRIFPFNGEIGSRSISVQTYNTDSFDHSFQVRFHLRDLEAENVTGLPSGSSEIIGLISSGDFTSDNPPQVPSGTPPPPPPPPPLPAPPTP